jgi:hypothetical protein
MIPVPPKYKKLAQRVEEHIARLNPPPPMPPVQRVIVQHDDPAGVTNAEPGTRRLALVRRIIMPQPTTLPEPAPEAPRGVEPRVPGSSNLGDGYR